MVAKEAKEVRNFMIFPEGTRSKNKNELLDFKGGSFKSAVKAKCLILPIALIDSYKVFDSNSIERITVQVHVLEPLIYEDYKDMKTAQIASIVKESIEKTIREASITFSKGSILLFFDIEIPPCRFLYFNVLLEGIISIDS